MDTKHCRGIGREPHVEQVTAFAANKAAGDGLQKLCRSCHSANMKAYHERMRALSAEDVEKSRASGVKRCNRCSTVGRDPIRPLRDFHESRDARDRKRPHCKDCVRELRWKRAGIVDMTAERYEAMLAQQNYRCAIPSCETRPARLLDVDHDHKTGEVRGLLCRTCNVTAGQARDSVDVLADLITYLNGDVGLKPLLE